MARPAGLPRVALLLIMSASAMYDMDESQEVSLIEEDAGPAPPVQYDEIPGLRYEPKSALEFGERTFSECQTLCTTRGEQCSAFSYDASKQECKISKEHLGYDPDFVMEQKTASGHWDYIPGMTGYARGYLRVEMKTEPQCKAMCVKAPACALFSYRKLDGLCLVSGRALAMDDNWTYYEKQGIARNSKGFPLPPKLAHAAKMRDVHAASAAFLERQMKALEKEQAERADALKAAAARKKAETERLEAASAKVEKLDAEIAAVKNSEKVKQAGSRHQMLIEVEKQRLQMKKASDIELDVERVKDDQGHNMIQQAKLAAAAKEKIAAGKAEAMVKSAALEAQVATYSTQAKEAVNAAKAAEAEASKEGVSEEEVKEHAGKKAAVDAENLNTRAMMGIKTRRKMQRIQNAKVARIERSADHAALDVGSDVTRNISNTLRLNILEAKGNVESEAKKYQDSEKLNAARDQSHLERMAFWRSKLVNITEESDQIRADLLKVQTAKDAALARVRMDMDLTGSEIPGRTATAKLEAVTGIEIERMKRARELANKEEKHRFLQRQRTAQAVADKAAQERAADSLGQEEEAPILSKVEQAQKKLEALAKAVSKMPKQDGARLLKVAQAKLDKFVKEENDALEHAFLNPPIKEVRKVAAESAKIVGFDVETQTEINMAPTKAPTPPPSQAPTQPSPESCLPKAGKEAWKANCDAAVAQTEAGCTGALTAAAPYCKWGTAPAPAASSPGSCKPKAGKAAYKAHCDAAVAQTEAGCTGALTAAGPYCKWGTAPAPAEVPSTDSYKCIDARCTDAWCNSNCNHIPRNCPPSYCQKRTSGQQ